MAEYSNEFLKWYDHQITAINDDVIAEHADELQKWLNLAFLAGKAALQKAMREVEEVKQRRAEQLANQIIHTRAEGGDQ